MDHNQDLRSGSGLRPKIRRKIFRSDKDPDQGEHLRSESGPLIRTSDQDQDLDLRFG